MYRVVILLLGLLGVTLSLVLGLFLAVTWQIVAVLIAVSIGIPSLILTYETQRLEERVKPKKEKREQETVAEEDILRHETIRIGPHDAYSYEFKLKRDDTLKGEISSDTHIDIYFVNNTNFMKWEKGKTLECEYSSESVLRTKIDYEVPKRGLWHLIIENNGRKSAKVRVYLF